MQRIMRNRPRRWKIVMRRMRTKISLAFYAIVENATYIEDKNLVNTSEIFVPIGKEVLREDNKNGVTCLKFYLAHTDLIVEPLCVIPDIGGGWTDYFVVKN